jgi:hypothetical protein
MTEWPRGALAKVLQAETAETVETVETVETAAAVD